jgi:aryl-alcohol dehydrogenase-like predicted oxidoreductase
VDVYYIHAPDRRVPLEGLLAGINTLYQAGKFKRFGLSNYLATEVDEVVRVCREKGYVLPSVYQGNYSAVARRAETELLPTLRKHNISYNAYSPIAGGFLTKDVEVLVSGGEGRWDPKTTFGKQYHALYNTKNMLEGLKLWDKISKESGIPKVELAYRWVAHNSALSGESGDGVIFGTRTIEQLNQTLAAFAKGPLDSEIAAQIEQVWKIVEVDAPLDNFNDFTGKQ